MGPLILVVGEMAVLDRAFDPGARSGSNFAVRIAEQAIVARNNDRQIARLLELAGILDVASGAWLSPVDERGDISSPMAQIGETNSSDIEMAIVAANAIPGLFSDRRPPFAAPGLTDHVVCMVGNRNVGRAALFICQRSWHASVQTRLGDAIDRIRQLIHIVWVISREVPSGQNIATTKNDTSLAEAIIDQYPFGVVVLDLDQQIFLANKPAIQLFHNSGVIGLIGDRMALHHTHDAIRFHVALRSVLLSNDQSGARSVIAISGADGGPLLLSISRLSSTLMKASIVIARPSGTIDPVIQPMAEHFGLTPVEARVVAQLVQGLSVQEAATSLQLKVQTVRTYLKQIFHKTGAHRQVELFHLMRSGALPTLK